MDMLIQNIFNNRVLNLLTKVYSIADVDSKQIAKIFQKATEKREPDDATF
jgi:hypothetical protein